jgi:hypothetical protein
MRFTTDGAGWDRLVPAFVLPYAAWTLYVHAIVASHASFDTLMRGLPLLAVAALAATIGWFRLPDPGAADGNAAPAGSGTDGANGRFRVVPVVALACAVAWVGLLSAGVPYAVCWWIALLGMGGVWAWHLRGGSTALPDGTARTRRAWVAPSVVACVVAAAVCTTLFANRPDADDAYHLSVPATLLRLPQQAVLQHDTMYRLPDGPLLLPFYRLGNYDVLIAAVARATGIDHLVVAYALLPAVFASIGVFAWIYLLRRIVPARWIVVLPILFGCIVALGEVHRAYGNFAFVRLFQGKAILATCMVPAIAGAALAYQRHGGPRRWLLLFAAQVAAIGFAASAMFVAPAAAALGLAGGWSPGWARSRRFVLGLLASAYVLAAAWFVASGTRGQQVLAIASPAPMPGIPDILAGTWGPWSMRILLVALLSAWAFARDPARARYFSAGAFCFLLAALDPYTTPFVAEHAVGADTYWRLTWALPLPFFLAVALDGVLAGVLRAKPKALAIGGCLLLLAGAADFGRRHGTLRQANAVTLGAPRLKVPPVEYGAAREVAEHVPERETVLAPEAVASWLPIFVVHPETVGVRHMYLSLAFSPAETAQRSNMMRYVGGRYRPADAPAWFAAALRRHRVTAVVYSRAAPWSGEIERNLRARGWRPLSCGAYGIFVQGRPGATATHPSGCDAGPARP